MPNPSYITKYQDSLKKSKKIAIQTYEFTEKHLKKYLKTMVNIVAVNANLNKYGVIVFIVRLNLKCF